MTEFRCEICGNTRWEEDGRDGMEFETCNKCWTKHLKENENKLCLKKQEGVKAPASLKKGGMENVQKESSQGACKLSGKAVR